MKVAVLLIVLAFASSSEAKNVKSKIVGGKIAPQKRFPYQIALFYKMSFECGGCIISASWTLTAAHCVVLNGKVETNLSILAGTTSLATGGVMIKVNKTIVHKGYLNFENDIALMKLATPLQFTKSIQPIPLADAKVPASASVIVSGWGFTSENGSISENLLYLTLPVQDQSECFKIYKLRNVICLVHVGQEGSCYGDSGGPAVYNGKLIGILNGSKKGCASNYPDVYADVFSFSSWIQTTINSN